MIYPKIPYRIFPLGDNAVTVDFGNRILESLNDEVIARFHDLQHQPLPGIKEVTPAYSSFTVHYDVRELRQLNPGQTAYETISRALETFLAQPTTGINLEEKLFQIPVCYSPDLAMDIHRLAEYRGITIEELIEIHTAKIYKVFMMGFLPGFAYMGEVDEKIAMPRKPQPETVMPGSVGIAGRQTGIYPLTSPGGWQIIGRTPMKLFDKKRPDPVLLKTGDRIQFYSISRHEFENI
jgi:inhibitor of KinA